MSFHKTFDPLRIKQNLMRGESDIASSDVKGQVLESGYTISDTQMTDLNHVLRTAASTDGNLALKMDKVPSATLDHLASFDASGQVKDSSLKLDDAAPAAVDVLYSSLKLTKKTYVRGAIDAMALPDLTSALLLTGNASVDPESAWVADTFTAIRDGVYTVHCVLKLLDGQTASDSWIEVAIGSPLGVVANRTVYGGAVTGVQNDSLWVEVCDSVKLAAGDTVKFYVWQHTGFAKTVDSAASFFTISEL